MSKMDAVKKFFSRKNDESEETGAPVAAEGNGEEGGRKPRFAEEPAPSGGKKSARFAEPPPPSPGKVKKDKPKRVTVVVDEEGAEGGKKKSKPTAEKKKEKSQPPPSVSVDQNTF